MRRIALVAAVAAAAVLLPSRARAQDQWESQVRSLLEQGGQQLSSHGYTMTHRIYTGALNNGARESVQVSLEAGKEYQLVGACDTDCSDLDFVLFDGNGRQLDSDVLDDDVPIVSVTVSQSGSFTLQVMMVTCTADPCRYGVGVFGK